MNNGNQQRGGSFYLVLKGGALNGKHFEIPPQGLVVGRSTKDDIVLPDGRISRHHARFYVKGGLCYVQDQGSRNGVLVEGRKTKKTCLKDGDTVDLGYCSMRLRTEGTIEEGPSTEESDEPHAREEKEERRPPEPVSGVPFHPFAIASLVFVLLARWLWIFALGAVVFAVLALIDIRRRARHYGKALAVIGLVLGLAVGATSYYLRNAPGVYGASDQCQQNLRVVYSALKDYAAAHGGRYPMDLAELAYLGERDRLTCPSCSRRGGVDCTYLFLAAGRRHDPSLDAVIACDRSLGNHGRRGGYVLRANGTVEWLAAHEFEVLVPEF